VGEGFGDGAADDSAADDESIDLVHDVLGYDRQDRRELVLSRLVEPRARRHRCRLFSQECFTVPRHSQV
jgi:hypothetical protein